MGMIQVECVRCGKSFSCARESIASKSKLCGDCVKFPCPECSRVLTLDKVTTLAGLHCPHCDASLDGVFKRMGA